MQQHTMKLSSYIYPILLFISANRIDAFDFDRDVGIYKVNINGNEVCVNADYFLNVNKNKIFNLPPDTFSSLRTGNNKATAYGSKGCNGKSHSFPISHQESRCKYCWDSCGEKFNDNSSAHGNVMSYRIPKGVVALAFNTCLGSYGYSDPGYQTVLEPGCHDTNGFDVAHLTFATESKTTPGTYEVIGKPDFADGNFEDEMSVEHWMYGPDGIKNAEGTSWYQYIFELLDPTEPRMQFQVGNGGTWLKPTQSKWKPGDPCRCSPLAWPATGGGETCNKADLTKCTNGCCGTDGCGGLLQTMEGGSGYWLGKLPTPRVKWTIGSVTKCYSYWSNSPLEVHNSQDLECADMGVIAVSNRLLYPPDGIGFVDDGMLGHAWINTPLGKVEKNDENRRLTLILDTNNFKGPVAYMLPEWYDVQTKWQDQNGNYHPAETFTNTGMSTGGGAFEWSTVPVYGHNSKQTRNIRIPKMQFSFNEGENTVLMSAGKSYTEKSDLFTPLDKAMTSKKKPLDESQLLTLDSGHVHECGSYSKDLRLDFKGKPLHLGATIKRRKESDGMCSAVVEYDEASIALNCNSTHCKIKDSFKVVEESVVKKDGEWSYDPGQLRAYDSIPKNLQGKKVFPEHSFWLNYDRSKPNNLCGAKPASKKVLYCRQTSTSDWIAWRWYAFQNQPGFQRLKLNKQQKRFLKKRMKNLHKKMEANSPLNDWLKTPSSTPDLVTIDPKLLIDPPKKFKYGFVPIVVYQGMEKPESCKLA